VTSGESAGATAPTVPVSPTAAVPTGDHRYAVGVRTDTYVDRSRPTSAVPGYAGAPERTFPVTVWYPAAGDPDAAPVADAAPDRRDGPFPLVLFSHGYAVTPDYYEVLLARWAAAGYVVAAPAYPLESGIPAGPSHVDFVEVFTDARFVLGQVLADLGTTTGSHPLAGMVDPARVATAGQSDGLIPAYGLGFLQCCRDPRVKAVIAMAGIIGYVNNPVTRDSGIPVLHLMGEADELQPYGEASAWDRDNLTAPRWMLTLVGGGHVPPYRDPASPHFDGVVETTTAFLDGTIGGRTGRLTAIDDYVAAHPDQFRLER
jgi:dienelactone hydrolase